MTKAEILTTLRSEDVKFLRLQFIDILGNNKNVEVPASQFEKALDGEIMFDGSSIQGFTRIEESDMLLKPDYDTFRVFPIFGEEVSERGRVARLICDIALPNDEPFEGDPRYVLRRVIEKAQGMGFSALNAGPEAEFFLFEMGPNRFPSLTTHDSAGYFDLAPMDRAEPARRDIVNYLGQMGFEVEAAHHEVAIGQHEIDFKYADALTTADNIATFRFVVRRVAQKYGLHATFMPKPIAGINGSGMHTHLSLFRGGDNAFFNPDGRDQLSETALCFIGGLLEHASAFVAITNPLVNSYKRLVPGYEAPTNIAWSAANRSAMIRIPARRGPSTRAELRMPDPAANPYLALAVMFGAGLDGIETTLMPPPAIQKNIFHMSIRDKRRHKIKELPGTLNLAVDALEKSRFVRGVLGDHIFAHYIEAKRLEWEDYKMQVHAWEVERYLTSY
ncbi:type I glutamate--ammonia ligase [soil metagenome]|jgi:glutamine synthetase|nr:type I glutamate--ammonia ligase [Deinococcota bacterium]